MNQQFKTPIPYGPDGCQVHIGNQICRETQTLQIIKEFNRIYESKLNELGSIGGGDNLSAKVHLQQDWIRDLTLQNEMLARTVEELEKEAAERVTMLESQLHCGSQVMQRYKDKFSVYLNETFQNLDYLQNDVSSLIEFVRRVRDNNEWSIDGLNFYTIKPSCLLKTCSVCDCPGPYPQNLLPVPDANELQLQKQETGPGGPKAADLEELNLKLRLKEEELNSMKRSAMAVRDSLLVDVSDKHDEILSLRCELQKFQKLYSAVQEENNNKDACIEDLMCQLNILNDKSADKLQGDNDKKSPHKVISDDSPKSTRKKLCRYCRENCEKSASKDVIIKDLKTELDLLKDRISKVEDSKSKHDRIRSRSPPSAVPRSLSPLRHSPSSHSPPVQRSSSLSPRPTTKRKQCCMQNQQCQVSTLPEEYLTDTVVVSEKSPETSQNYKRNLKTDPNQASCRSQSPPCTYSRKNDVQSRRNCSSCSGPNKETFLYHKENEKYIGSPPPHSLAEHCQERTVGTTSLNRRNTDANKYKREEVTKLESSKLSTTSPKKRVVSSDCRNKHVNSPFVYLCQSDGVQETFLNTNSQEHLLFSSENCYYNSDMTITAGKAKATFKEMSKRGCSLTANKVLHEYYGISDSSGSYGVIKNFQEMTKVDLINVPQCSPIKTYINNLEMNIKKSQEARIVALLKMDGNNYPISTNVVDYLNCDGICANMEVISLNDVVGPDLNLFFSLGNQINKMLQDLHNKDKEILNQRDTINLLGKIMHFLFTREKHLQHRTIINYLCEYISRFGCNNANKKQKSKNTMHRSADVETDCSELRKRFKELEDENNQLKDTIFQANRELEKFYEQANDYLKERDEYKRLYNESVDALTLAERKSMMHEEALSKMNEEHVKIKEEITTCRRQSESLSQAQNETIQALQEAIREKEKASELVPLTSDESWTSTTVSTTTKGPICSCYSIGPPVDDGTPKDPSHIKKDGVSVKEIECPKPYPCAGEKLQQDLDAEREIHKKEVDNLKKTITELEKGGLDTIKSLEDAYEESKLEISHQRITISNLQEALKVCKGQLDELEKKSSSDMENFTHLEYKCVVYFNQIKKLNAFIDHLQETNLGLEVDIFEYVQDVALLESRLLKYQSNFRMGYDLRNRVKELECECEAMKRIVNEAKELHQSYRIMQTTKEDLQVEAEYARQELMRESQLKGLNEARIQELQQRLGEKTCEVSRCDDMLSDMQNKLCWAVCQNNQLKKDVSTLLCHVNNYEQNYIDNDERTDICQQEIEVCKENLTDLKDKLLMMKGLLQQKIDEYTQLETKFCAQSKSLACMNEQISLSEQQYEKEICILRCTVEELQNKLLASEANCECLREDYERTQVAMQDYAQMESKLQKEFATNINEAHNEIVTLNTYVNQLQNECSCIKQELKAKEQQIGSAKAQIAHYRMSESADFVALQDENKKLRNELNRVVQQHETFQAKNEALCMQLCEVKKSAMSFERQAQMNERHLQKCMYELQHLRDVKDQLEVANDELRCAYKELCARYQEVLVSVPILNNEIVEYKSKNEDLLTESRNLINNVRAWLENQALINQEVSQKFSDDHLVIRNLSQKIVALQKYQCPHSSSRLHAGSNLEGSESITSDASVESEENIDQSPKAIDNSDEDMDVKLFFFHYMSPIVLT
ncbi:hypothetical protein FQR65_LT13740 [Abscondita terminalis]|nr:hypothetical protein FQR65_LT13740 [Abscondita terminalis]